MNQIPHSSIPDCTIHAIQWQDLPVTAYQKEQKTEITEFYFKWPFDKPTSDISYYPDSEQNELRYTTQTGPCVLKAYGNMTAEGGTQCCIRSEKTGDIQQSMIHLHFVQPTSTTEVIPSESDAHTASAAGSENTAGETTISEGQSVRDKLDGDSGGSVGTGWEFGSFGKRNAKKGKSSAAMSEIAKTTTTTAVPSHKKLAIKSLGSTSRSEAEEAKELERAAIESWRQQRQSANEVTRKQNRRM